MLSHIRTSKIPVNNWNKSEILIMKVLNNKKRFEVSFPQESFAILQKAAQIKGQTINSYIAGIVLSQAMRDINEFHNIGKLILSEQGWKDLEKYMENPPPDSESLKAARNRVKKIRDVIPDPEDLY